MPSVIATVLNTNQRYILFYFQGTLEEKVYQRQISKQGLSGVIMDAKTGSNAQGNVKFSREDLRVCSL